MLTRIEQYFYELTERNWGFPYHLIISWFATDVGSSLINAIPAGSVVLLIGLIYEIYQKSQGDVTQQEFNEDMAANLAGVILGMLL